MAVDHGYGHVQIHAAHGYLPNLLVDARINPNAGYVRDRFSELAVWLKSQSVESSIRCTMKSGNVKFDERGSVLNLDELIALPFDYVDLSSGFYNIDKRLIYPSRPDIVSARQAENLAVISRHPGRKFIASGKIMEQLAKLPQNASLGICRDLIANPAYLSEQADGCRNHGKCHYHSRGEKHITCSRWTNVEPG